MTKLIVVTDCSFNVNESGDLEMLPQYPNPYKEPKKFKNQMQHHLRFFRFNHRTLVPSGKELTIEDFFAPETTKPVDDDDIKLIDEYKSKP